MNPKHTPGPWGEDGCELMLDPVTQTPVALTRIHTSLGDLLLLDRTNESGCNWRLVCAAPDLRAACALVVARLPKTGEWSALRIACADAVAKAS